MGAFFPSLVSRVCPALGRYMCMKILQDRRINCSGYFLDEFSSYLPIPIGSRTLLDLDTRHMCFRGRC